MAARTQAEWDAERRARKARAAVTVAANAKEAEKAKKKALAKGVAFNDGGLKAKADKVAARSQARADAKANPKGGK